MQSHFDIGERHILPLYPFALLIAGGIWEHARKHRCGMAVVILALCLNAADALRYAPDYLAYFNVFVKPENSWRLLTDSNLDWGQGLLALRAYEQQHPDEDIAPGLLRIGRSHTVWHQGQAAAARPAGQRQACHWRQLPLGTGAGRQQRLSLAVVVSAATGAGSRDVDVRHRLEIVSRRPCSERLVTSLPR